MKVMQKRIYDKGDNILNSYQFDDINGIVDINKTLSILLESGVLIEEIIINEFGDIYDNKRTFSYDNIESFVEKSNDYKDMLIYECILLCKVDNIKITCVILPLDNVLRIQYGKNLHLNNGLNFDSYSDTIANEVNSRLTK